MNWETNNPTLVKLIGAGLAIGAIVAGATIAAGAMPTLSVIAGALLGAVGINITGKQS